jgi:hypothetical protein
MLGHVKLGCLVSSVRPGYKRIYEARSCYASFLYLSKQKLPGLNSPNLT